MHSSGMRTARLLTVSQHALRKGGVYPSMHWVWGGVCPGPEADTPTLWTESQTPGKHITFAQLRLRAVKTRRHSSRMCTARFCQL